MNAAFNAMHNEARACIQLAEVENNLVLKAILMGMAHGWLFIDEEWKGYVTRYAEGRIPRPNYSSVTNSSGLEPDFRFTRRGIRLPSA